MSLIDRPSYGIALRLASGLLFAGMYISVKAVSEVVPLGEIVFFRSFFALIPLVVFLWFRSEFPQGLGTKRPLGHIMRSGFGTLALFGYFATLAQLNLAETVLIFQISPVFLAIIAVVALGERLTIWRIGGLTPGLMGVVVLVWPDLGVGADQSRLLGYGLGIASALLTAIAMTMVRSLNQTESPGAIAFYFALTSTLAGLLTLGWGWVWPSPETLALLILAGLFGGFAHIAMTLAFKYAEASRLAAFEYVALLWPLLADLLIFRASLSSAFWIAAPIILIAGAVAAAERDRKKTSSAA